MRLAIITATPQTVSLGSGTHVATGSLARALRALGHETDIIAPRSSPTGSRFGVRRFLFNYRLDRTRVERADVAIGIDMDGWTLAGRTTRPFVAYPHGIIAEEARFERGRTRLAFRLQAAAERWSVQRADLVLALSHHSARRLVELYDADPNRIRVAQPGVDLSLWSGALRRAISGPPLHPGTQHRPTVLSVGRLYRRKNTGALLRAAALLRTEVPGLLVRIVGDGPERARLHRLAATLGLEGTVRFTGQVGFDQLAAEYVRCDVFCLPTLQEGFGLAFVEAMAAGKPIVACRASATPELVEDGKGGLLVDPGDDRRLADALRWMLAHPREREQMGQANTRAAQGYDMNTAARRFIKAISWLATEGSVPRDSVTGDLDSNYAVQRQSPRP